MIKIKIIPVICVVLFTAGISHAQGWRGLVPLHSTRKDVESIIGSPTTPGGSTYKVENETVQITYSDGLCEEGWPFGWNVQPDTVVNIAIYPPAERKLTDLGFDLNKYEKIQSSEVEAIILYSNENEGILIEFNKFLERINLILYTPVAKDAYQLCPEATARLSEEKRKTHYTNVFDSYGDIPFNKERKHLNTLAKQLKSEPEMKGYFIIYAGRRARACEAQRRMTRAKNYLINELGVKPEQIVIIDGGYREELIVELYVVPRNSAEPLTLPTVRPSKVQIIGITTIHYRQWLDFGEQQFVASSEDRQLHGDLTWTE